MVTSRSLVSPGRAVPVGLMLAAAISACASSEDTPMSDSPPEVIADSLIALWIDSLGGMETYEAFRSASYTITTVIYDTLSGRTRRMRPRYVWIKRGPDGQATRVERWEGDDFITQGFNGRDAWATMNGEMLPDTAKDWREVRYVAGDLYYWPGLPYKLRDDGVFLHYLGMVNRPGAELRADPTSARQALPDDGYHAIAVTFGENVGDHQDAWAYYFAPGEGFPTEVTYIEDGRTDLNRIIWGPTERFGGIDYPFVKRRDWITESGKRTKALVVSEVVINPEIPQEMFERPEM